MALSPDQLADLRRSGLTDHTIALMQCAGVRPKELPIKTAESAYAIPYFDLVGKPNCFVRLKLVPAVTNADGRSMKYWQQQGSPPHMYVPPLRDWQRIAKDVSISLIFTEGEKKAAAGCQAGLAVLGIGGVWCWTSTLKSGDKLILPMLDEFLWADRLVLLCPDSDAWHAGKEMQILAGFFALAKELQQRGAIVQFVVLPDLHGHKAGLDDWLLQSGNDVEHAWPRLERLALDDPRLSHLTAWWQNWKERRATHDALHRHDLDDLDLTEAAGLYIVRAPTHAVRMTFDRLSDQRGGVSAELTVRLGETDLLAGVDVGLKSDSGQTKLASSLKVFAPAMPWKLLLQRACSLVLMRHRQGEPPIRLDKSTQVEPLTYSLNPLVFTKKTSIMYGDGGLGKSTLALLAAMCVSMGGTIAGISAQKGCVLYLDYEDDVDVHVRRLQAIQAGHPTLTEAHVQYQRCVEPLTRLVYPLMRRIHDAGITFVVLDSLLASTGGDASADGTAKLFTALRQLNCDILAIGHVPKTQGEGQEHATVYGSVFNQNFARSVWELKKEQDIGEDTAILGLFNRKSNLSRLHHPIGLKVTQNADNTRIVYDPYDLSQAAELANALSLSNRIRNLLDSDGIPRTSEQIADELNAKLGSVKTTLSKYKNFKWSMIGKGKDTKWTTITG